MKLEVVFYQAFEVSENLEGLNPARCPSDLVDTFIECDYNFAERE